MSTTEFFNPTTGQWEEQQQPVDISPLGITRRAPTQDFMHPSHLIRPLLDVLAAARVVDAKFDCGGFSDPVYGVLIGVFGDSLNTLHFALQQIVGDDE